MDVFNEIKFLEELEAGNSAFIAQVEAEQKEKEQKRKHKRHEVKIGDLLDTETSIGELLKDTTSRAGRCNKRGEKELPPGITHKQSHYFQAMAEHPDLAGALLDAEVKINELWELEENKTKGGRGKTGRSGGTSLQDYGFSKQQMHCFRQ